MLLCVTDVHEVTQVTSSTSRTISNQYITWYHIDTEPCSNWDWFQQFRQKNWSFKQQIFGILYFMNDQNNELITKLAVDKSASYLISSVSVQNMLSGLGVNRSETVMADCEL